MTTSALSLYQLLTAARSHKPLTDRFLTVLADHLELGEPDSEAQVVRLLTNLIISAESDIEKLPIEDTMKAHLRRHIAQFNGIKNFSQIHLDIKNAQASFLKPEHLNGLTDLHLALTGHIEFRLLGKDAKNLAEKFRDLNGEILGADLPPDLKRIVLKRTGQIASILEHYYAFGGQSLREELEGLVGAIVVNPPSKGSNSIPLYQKIAAFASAGFVLLAEADDAATNAISLADKVSGFIEFMDDENQENTQTVENENGKEAAETP